MGITLVISLFGFFFFRKGIYFCIQVKVYVGGF